MKSECKYYIDTICKFYNRRNVENICCICKHFKKKELIKQESIKQARDCDRFYYDDRFCLYKPNGDSILFGGIPLYREKGEICKHCQWPEGGDIFLNE